MKTCFKCHEAKPLSEFYRHSMMADGHLGKCKVCAKADVAARYERLKETDPSFIERERARGREKHRRLYSSGLVRVAPAGTPEQKKRAADLVNNAVRDGRMQKSDNCEDCGRPYHRIEGHHEDYSRPFDVRWLCKPCHSRRHLARSA